jgi:carboxypeptidase C (cathepsin A)
MRSSSLAPLAAFLVLALAARAAESRPAATTPPPNPPDEPGQTEAPAIAGQRAERASTTASRPALASSDTVTAPVREIASVTHHSITIDGAAVPYEATAGTLTLRDDDGKPSASMFYVAYTAENGKGNPKRPITFFYNGGPGSASPWLHLGSFGPMVIQTDSPNATHNPPFTLSPNNDSLLDRTDMVFLDAIGAGYSRPLGDAKGEKFWGVDQDVDAFARAITRYITVNHRWNSPKFLFGESYGTTRSAALVFALQRQGVQFNGVSLLSSILNYGIRNAGFDRIYIGYLPSYAAAAWYHNKLAKKPADLPAFLQEVRAWAAGPYLTALEKGSDLSPQESDAIARQLSAYTGLSVQFLQENHLRVSLSRFRKELLRDQHRTLGRYDARFTGIDADDGGDTPEFDASSTGITGAYIGALHHYLETDLQFRSDLRYWPSGPEINVKWDWHHKPPTATPGGTGQAQTQPAVVLDLSAAMRENPHLQVFSLNGWYDMATPFFETEFDLKHMGLEPALMKNIRFAYYPAGHMVYLNRDALKQMKADVAKFYDDVLK